MQKNIINYIPTYLPTTAIYKIVDEELEISHEEQIKYINEQATRILDDESIIEFLDKKRKECEPITQQILYTYRPEIPKHYDTSIAILKNKLLKLFALVDYIMSPDCNSDSELLKQYDINVVNGKISSTDVARLAKPIFYCFSKLQEIVDKANNFQSYIGIELQETMRGLNNVTLSECLPDENLQTDEMFVNDSSKEFIPYSEEQAKIFTQKQNASIKSLTNLINKGLNF